jgi:hydroxyacylglutathione hydrolase
MTPDDQRIRWPPRRRLRITAAVFLILALCGEALRHMPQIAAWQWYMRAGRPAMTSVALSPAPQFRWVDDYYIVSDLGEGAYAIGEPRYGQCNFSYLIVGSERALLFDTGPGLRDIRTVVRKLTDLPVEALPSHLHFDHTGDIGLFDRVALPDLPALRAQVRDGRFELGFYQFLGFVEGFRRPSFRVADWIRPGSDIDLGDRRLTLYSVPGHTPDSVVLVDTAANRMFAGDFIYPSDIYAFLPGANLRDYAASAGRVSALLNDRTAIYGAHGCDKLPAVDVPMLRRADLVDLARSLAAAAAASGGGKGWYPRILTVNQRLTLLAAYPWMSP